MKVLPAKQPEYKQTEENNFKSIEQKRKGQESKESRRQKKRIIAERVAKWGIPSEFILFCIFYFSVGILLSY